MKRWTSRCAWTVAAMIVGCATGSMSSAFGSMPTYFRETETVCDASNEKDIMAFRSSWSTPRIVDQSWDARTRCGRMTLLVPKGAEEEAMAWLRDEYLPEYCRLLGVAISADNPVAASHARIDINKLMIVEGEKMVVEFYVVE